MSAGSWQSNSDFIRFEPVAYKSRYAPDQENNDRRCDETRGAFFWDYSGYSYSGLGITEYTEFQFRKERQFWERNTHGGGDLRTTMSAHARATASDFPPKISQQNAYSVYSE